MRDDEWLTTRFNQIWKFFFSDIEKKNIQIIWKGHWKNKFGHIGTTKNKQTGHFFITNNQPLKL